ncbi:MAG TPA: carboxypeptidase-like regulatory domain-containing protein [Gemmatimonadales bacterium]|jgi:hypothetical protein|nr:carboxypeptidase-like regulatory domain-containing protein [Gemmatimonadales bacterium]
MRTPFSVFAAALWATPLTAQAVLSGAVQDTARKSLEGVEVIHEKSTRRATTDNSGRFLLDSLPAGNDYFLMRLIGFKPVRFRARLGKGDTVRVMATLAPLGVRLDPVVVVADAKRPRGGGYDAFEERRSLGLGKFIDSTEMRRSEHLRLGDLLRRHVPGIEVKEVFGRGGQGRRTKAFNRNTLLPCELTVFLNGIRIPDPDLKAFDPASLQAAEIYRNQGEIPMEYGGRGQECGVILLWSRRG